MSCVTLMANRSDRRFQILSPRMAARGRETDQPNEARGNPSRPGLHRTPDKQAGYMTATEFQIAPAIQPLTRAGSIYVWRRRLDLTFQYPHLTGCPNGLKFPRQENDPQCAIQVCEGGVCRGRQFARLERPSRWSLGRKPTERATSRNTDRPACLISPRGQSFSEAVTLA